MVDLKFGLVGCGKISKKHIAALKLTKGASLGAVCDTDKNKAEELGKANNVPWFQSHKEMIKETDIDVVSVLTPSGTHAEIAVDALNSGKHVAVEKPLSLTLEDADKMIRAANENNVRLFEVKQNRFNKPIVKLKQAIEEKKFGKMILGTVRLRWTRRQDYYDQLDWRGTWAMDGGVIANQANHHIDLLSYLMGDVESVFCKIDTRLVNIEAEDIAVGTIKFSNGALGIIEATTAIRPKDLEGSISILGESGSVVVGGFSANKIQTWEFEDENYKIPKDSQENPDTFAYNHGKFYENVVETINNNGKAMVDGEEAKKTLEIIIALYESAETGEEINLKFKPKKTKLGKT